MAEEELKSLKEAIIDLYLAIKIRSTEELDKIDEDHLHKEKQKLLRQDGFQILEYIRSSIEIIMNLKIEDLEREMSQKKASEAGGDTSSVGEGMESSASSKQFVHQSMKEALSGHDIAPRMESQKGSKLESNKGGDGQQRKKSAEDKKSSNLLSQEDPPKEYEKMLQKLEADIRGHIRLEHEMKIHLDYLEGRVEELENENSSLANEKKRHDKKVSTIEDKLKQIQDEKENLAQKVEAERGKMQERIDSLEKKNKALVEKMEKESDLSHHHHQQSTINHSTLNHSVDFTTNTFNSFSQKHSNVPFNEKNIYQTIQEATPNQLRNSQVAGLTRNGQQIFNDKRKDKNHLSMILGSASNLQSKKKRNPSSKMKQNIAMGRDIMVSLLDYSQRNNPNNNNNNSKVLQQQSNPYIWEINSGKKAQKKKSESIDLQSKRGSSLKAQQYLRNSQNVTQMSMLPPQHQHHIVNQSMNNPSIPLSSLDQEQRWMVNSTDSDNVMIVNQNANRSMFIDYPQESQSLLHQQYRMQKASQDSFAGSRSHTISYSGKVPNSNEKAQNSSNNQRYGSNSVMQQMDLGSINPAHINYNLANMNKQVIMRPSSQLGKQPPVQGGAGIQQQKQIRIKEKSRSKNRQNELQNNSFSTIQPRKVLEKGVLMESNK